MVEVHAKCLQINFQDKTGGGKMGGRVFLYVWNKDTQERSVKNP